MKPQLVWLKKDLRIQDHEPLRLASEKGPVICLYVYELSWMQAPDFDAMHLHFINQSLTELAQELEDLGGRLITRVGEVVDVLEDIYQEESFEAIWAHQETGNDQSYQRDLAVHQWSKEKSLTFIELPQNGVVRRLKNRDGWSKLWEQRMATPLVRPPKSLDSPELESRGIVSARELGFSEELRPEALKGGETEARQMLKSFLKSRGKRYSKELSSPVTAFEACSRLSPYLTFGNISMRTVVQLTKRAKKTAVTPWKGSLQAFLGRLHWHCHFIQKLEDEPELEFQNMNRTFDGLREEEFDEEKFQAWCEARTGYPMVDACMRALHLGGWINFRMRAMLVSFASYHLWLHWKRPALYLATQFIDYEPGIHYSQHQMQAGTTGINAIRIYSPAKQVLDLDPEGLFIKRYLPELKDVPVKYLSQPETMPLEVQQEANCLIGKDYPEPIVDHKIEYNKARKRIYAHKKRPEVQAESERILQKHGSRRVIKRGRA